MSEKKATLLLADGTKYIGSSIGKKGTTIGEIVFNTAMTGYLETLTDKSYFGQIILQTFPLIGNYGINADDVEGDNPKANGYIVNSSCKNPSNFRSNQSLNELLNLNNIVAIENIDTRSLTKKIREYGVINGAITTEEIKDKNSLLQDIKNFKIRNCLKEVSTKNIKIFKNDSKDAKNLTICIFDFGIKKSIANEIKKRVETTYILPYDSTIKTIKDINPDGIILSNGPGNPADNKEVIANLKEIQKAKIPTFGICLGHQLLAIVNGFETKKLKYGHRGANQPVKDITANKILITSQNHGYYVTSESVNQKIAKISHISLNDNTCEGIKYENIPAFTLQFHPESCPGPLDANLMFDEFFKSYFKF